MMYVSRPNSWVSKDISATTQLSYGLQVNPAPLTVSIAGEDPILASLEFVVTNPSTKPITLTSVAITINVGQAGTNITTTTALAGATTNDPNWQVQLPGSITDGPATFTMQSQTGPLPVAPGTSIVVQIYNLPTVENPGNTTISLKETVGGSSNFVNFQLTTFPTGFYFNDLAVTAANGSQLVPVAQVNTGTIVSLIWNSSVVDSVSFAIYYSNAASGQQQATPVEPGLWVSPPLTADTVFTVMVTVSVEGGVPLSASMSTSVAVQNPSLMAQNLTTRDFLTVDGFLTVTTGIKSSGLIVGPGMSPPGAIIMYYGNISDSAHFGSDGKGVAGTSFEDWQVCNGNNGSPNLLDKFIPAAGGSYTVGQQGGADAITLSNAQMPVHSHGGWTGVTAPYLNYQSVAFNSQGVSSGLMVNRGTPDPNGNRPNLTTTTGWPMVQVNNHNHSIGNDGGGQSHENRPQFFALAYLYKLA